MKITLMTHQVFTSSPTPDIPGRPSDITGYVLRAANDEGKVIWDSIEEVISLDELTDVDISSLLDGQILIYDNNDQLWKNKTINGDANIDRTGTLTLSNTGVVAGSYTGVDLTVDSKGRITTISNGAGVVISLGLLSDVTLTAVADTQLLVYDSGSTQWENQTNVRRLNH